MQQWGGKNQQPSLVAWPPAVWIFSDTDVGWAVFLGDDPLAQIANYETHSVTSQEKCTWQLGWFCFFPLAVKLMLTTGRFFFFF